MTLNRTLDETVAATDDVNRTLCDHKNAGFSLVELVSVMAVVSVVSGIAVAGLGGSTSASNLDAGARKVAEYLQIARSEAISRHSVVRFVVATDWPGQEDANLRRFSLWAWDSEVEQYQPITKWEELPVGVILEPQLPDYVRTATYAEADPSSVRAACVLAPTAERASFQAFADTGEIYTKYIEYMPSGNVRIPGDGARSAAFVVVPGHQQETGELFYAPRGENGPANWAQVNVDALTGNVRVYRP